MVSIKFSKKILTYLLNVNYKASVNCESPSAQLDDSIMVMGYSASGTARGTNITFSCPPELVLTGPNSSTCMGNGEWEPDIREVECKGESTKI